MTNQKFPHISTKSKVSVKIIIFWVILVFLIIGGIFAYECWRGTKKAPTFGPAREKKIEVKTGITTLEEWGAMKKIKIPKP